MPCTILPWTKCGWKFQYLSILCEDWLVKPIAIHLFLLGIRLIARNGLNTRTVLMVLRLSFSTSRQYSKALKKRLININESYSSQIRYIWPQFQFILSKMLPCKNDEEIKTIPSFREITTFSYHSHCNNFNAKF